jgi:hypothetical protein
MASRSRLALALRRARFSPASSTRPLRPLPQYRWQSTASNDDAEPPTSSPKTIAFTSETYPEIKRNSKFSEISSDHITFFKELLGKESAVIDGVTQDATDDLEPFNGDWMRKYRGHTKLVLKPGSTEEVSKILKYCNDNMLAVVPQGGNSGLVGGSVPVFDEIVINMSRMNEIRSFDEVSGALVVDAGVILEVADNFLGEKGHIFPLDLGAKG